MSLVDAIKIENEYLATTDRSKFYFLEKMEIAGYTDLNKYQNERDEYLFSQTKFVVSQSVPSTIFSDVQGLITAGNEGIFFHTPSKTFVYSGADSVKTSYCAANALTVVPLQYGGCTFVTKATDLNLVFALKNDLQNIILKKINASLNKLGIDSVVVCGNILVGKSQIVVSAVRKYNGYYVTFVQIIFSSDNTLLSNVCVNQPDRACVGISDISSVTRTQLITELKSWLQ